ncbi:hypothetical protein BC829DRAFT_360548, partial [Chytridium lagenaria]
CGPCKVIKPVVEQLSTKYSSVGFLAVDVDKLKRTAQSMASLRCPLSCFFKQGKKIDEMRGADPGKLEALIKVNTVPYFGSYSPKYSNTLASEDLQLL